MDALSAEEVTLMEQLQARHSAHAAFASPEPKATPAYPPKDVSTSKKAPTRSRDPLAPTTKEERYKAKSQKAAVYARLQRQEATKASAKAASDKAHNSAMARWRLHEERVAEAALHYQRGREVIIDAEALAAAERSTPTTAAERTAALKGKGVSTSRRNAIFFYYTVVLGSPPPKDEDGKDLWGGQRGTVATIREVLLIPEGSSRIVADVLADSWEAHQVGEQYDPDGRLRLRGRKALIAEDSDEAYLILQSKRVGMSLGDCTSLVNSYHRRTGAGSLVSYGAVQRFVAESPMCKLGKRGTKKSGKDDLLSDWCVARLAQCDQWLAQFRLGHTVPPGAAYPGPFPPYHVHAIAWWDEHHKKIRLGHASKWECRLRFDEDGNLAREEDGGVLEDASETTTTKYPGEARGCFGGGVRMLANGELEGFTLEACNYSGLQVIAPDLWETKRVAEERSKIGKASPWTASKKNGGQWLGYRGRFPDTWSEELDKAVTKAGFVCVTKLMKHVIDTSEAAFKGTVAEGCFFIFHDGLSQWWTPAAQAYMKSRGYEHRQMRILGPTNDRVCKRYRGKLVGDSPELCRGLDAHGFADLDAAVALNCSLASFHPRGHPLREKWSMAKVDTLFAAMNETWLHCAPTGARMLEDVAKIEPVLEVIVAAKGGVVADEFYRTGRRCRRADDKGDCARKPPKRQRKETLVAKPCHPELEATYELLMDPKRAREGLSKAH